MKQLKKQIDRLKPYFEKGGKFQSLNSVFEGFYTFLFTPNETAGINGVHIHDSNDSKRTMITVVVALLPCLLFGMYNVGYQHFMAIGANSADILSNFWYGLCATLPQIIVAYVVGLGIEFVVAQIRGHEIQEGFLVSGILIPMICPIDTPLWMIAVAVAFAVIFAKEVFGGTGYNILNVALVTRAFLFFAYPSKMSGDAVFVSVDPSMAVDGYSGATPLAQLAQATAGNTTLSDVTGNIIPWINTVIGNIPGSWGETSVICIAIGAAILLFTGIASWRIILSALIGGLSMAFVVNCFSSPLYPVTYVNPLYQLCLGGFAFAVVFMATDPVTACRTNAGKIIYGFLIGVIAILIRCYNTGYPEGAMLAVLLMNCFASLIDWCVIRVNIRRRLKRVSAK